MANPERMAQLERALRNADAAGDTAAATTLANEIRRQRAAGQQQPAPQQAFDSPVGPTGMIEVDLPDGTIAEFPEGTSRDVMRSALQRRFGTQQQPAQQGQNWWESAPLVDQAKPVTLNIGGKRVKVDGGFMQLSPEQQNATVDEIAASIGVNQPGEQNGKNWWDDAPLVEPGNATTQENASQRGPWEKYQAQPEVGPWQKYAAQQDSDSRNGFLGKVDTAMRGAADMLSFGFADEIAAGGDALFNPVFGTGQEGGSISERYDRNLAQQRVTDAADAQERFGYRLGGQLAGGVGGGVGLAKNGLSLAGRAIENGAKLRTVAGASALEGAVMGAGQGFGSGEGGLDNRLTSAGTGAKWGLGFGLATPVAVAGVSAGVRRAVTPFASSPERQALADVLKREGVDLTAGQRTGSERLRYAENEIGGRVARRIAERQGEQFTAAALRRAGIDANRATPEVMDAAFTRIGQQFDGLASRNRLMPDQQFASDLSDTIRGYNQLVNETARAPIVMDTAADIAQMARNGITGEAYQALRSRLDQSARASARDPQLQDALYGLRNTLDDGMERSIIMNNPSDLGKWREARSQYRNMLVLEKASTGAGENAAQGLISPSQLRNATVVGQGRRNYARGKGDFADIARAGEAVMKPLPNSGTAGRINAQNLGAGMFSTLGGIAGTAGGGIPIGLLGAVAGATVPKVAGRTMMTKIAQAYLGNQQFQQSQMKPGIRAILNALMNAEQSAAAPRILGQERRSPLEITVRPNY